jgi:mono/diheme cytochrome c family protein
MRFKQFVPLAIAALSFVSIIGCGLLDPNPGPNPVTTQPSGGSVPVPRDSTPVTAERGAQIYAQYCARCHGDSAEGSKIWLPPIQGRAGIGELVHGGRRAMPAFATLSDSAIASIEAFLAGFHVDYGAKTGRELYVTYCSSCHGDSALGTSTFQGSIQGHEAIHDIVRSGRREMKPVDIPDSIIAKIQDYLLSLRVDLTNVSGAEYYARECAKCHGASGEGTTRGYEIRNPVVGYATYVMRNGRSGRPFADSMPKYTPAMLSDRQLTEILTMLRAAQHPSDGKSLYNRFCANCHGTNAKGGIVGKNITREIGDFQEKVREGEGGSNYASRTKYMPKWPASELSNAEISSMAAYVTGLR